MKRPSVTFEFHVSRQARDCYRFDDVLFTLSGNVIFANFHAARVFAQKMNEKRDLVNFPEQAVKPGQINAMGLVDEILHYMVGQYREQVNPNAMRQALEWLEVRLGREAVDASLRRFGDSFPTVAVYRREVDLETYLAGETAGVPNRQIVLEEMLLLWLANLNPAFAPYLELFDDSDLRRDTAYLKIANELHAFFATQPPFGPDNQNLIDMLRAPALAAPHSLEDQLAFILERWSAVIGTYLYRLLTSLDVIKEERKLVFLGPGPTEVPVYDFRGLSGAGAEGEPEAFSPELEWMPSLVLMAKNIYVWLGQLSKRYGREITRLDEIPDEELDRLARWGFTGLWLIGVWERSPASQQLKQLCGNPDAVASAYSLYDYVIADDLGGGDAYQNLKDRAWQRGIRMASDMVPNHVGIYSLWVVEHPDWFVSLDYNPYPWYTYGGPDLSRDERVGIFLEDHYYDRTDAAVVFKRVDRWSGREQYIYHGNDGTSMPWNDTAQLNYLNPEVREAVIQTILHVARQFPVIRFDAAMTLAKRHYQRLWFPEPGSGGAIPTRAEHGLTRQDFDAAMPQEFWREVVDRVAQEAPDTLLLAEAFWLLEGYFVRTLGMHRVYNSAFMNILRDEENAKYRQVMKNTLEFDPEVLRRFVNFMNNPDERTAVDQFGKGDKYFGICTLMATMPGLPMFGHGQIEGFSEKYGMEFRRALWDETPDAGLIERHEREIFPLLRRRRLFAGVENFLLYDFFSPDGTVNEDVFAYSNRVGDERSLVIYHNAYRQASGWVRTSVAFAQKTGRGDEKVLVQRSLAEGLGLQDGDGRFSVFRDQASGLEYIRSNRQLREQGLFVELGAYKTHVFADFREVQDTAWGQYSQLAAYLDGRGVPSIEQAQRELLLQPVRQPFEDLVNAPTLRRLVAARVTEAGGRPDPELLAEVDGRVRRLAEAAREFSGGTAAAEPVVGAIMAHLEALLTIPARAAELGRKNGRTRAHSAALQAASEYLGDREDRWGALLGWAVVRALGGVVAPEQAAVQSRTWFDEWLLGRALQRAYGELGLDDAAATLTAALVRVLATHERSLWAAGPRPARRAIETLLGDTDVHDFLGVNRYRDVLWYSKERFDELLGGLLTAAVAVVGADAALTPDAAAAEVAARHEVARAMQAAEQQSDYQVEKLLRMAADGQAGAAGRVAPAADVPSMADAPAVADEPVAEKKPAGGRRRK